MTRADWTWLAAVVAIALAIRVWVPWALVFTPDHVALLETDAWYHLRAIEYLVHNFPHHLQFDPYASPAGQQVPLPPLLDFFVASLALVVGAGHPSPMLIRIVAVLVPPLLGAATVVAVYGVARLAAGRLAGLLAAVLAATLPGHFLDRTLLGFVDHHALESCLSMVLVYLFARLLRSPSTPIRSGFLIGVGLAALRLAWTSSALLVAVFGVWLVIDTLLGVWRGRGISLVPRAMAVAAMVALPVTWLTEGALPSGAAVQRISLLLLLGVAAGVDVVRIGADRGRWSVNSGLVALVGAGVAGAVLLMLVFPSVLVGIVGEMSRLRAPISALSVSEVRPLFEYYGEWSLLPAWEFFRTGFFLGLLGVGFMAFTWMRTAAPVPLLLCVWTLAMYVLTAEQNRFGYYLVPAVAVVAGCVCAAAIRAGRRAGRVWGTGAAVAVAVAGVGVNLVPALATATRLPQISGHWLVAADWMRVHTDEPFGDSAYFFARYDASTRRQASWNVMVWWDYGYLITAAARRVPVALPTSGGAVEAATFFLEQDQEHAVERLKAQKVQYVVVDDYLPISPTSDGSLFGKFGGIVDWTSVPRQRYFQTFFVREGAGHQTRHLFFEDYYRTMTYRLGVLGGGGATPVRTLVVSWREETVSGVGLAPVITALETYATYEDARRRLAALGPGNHAIVSDTAHVSPVPLDPVTGLQRVFATPAQGLFRQGAVQIFQLTSHASR